MKKMRVTVIKSIKRYLLGRDVFISYSHRDGRKYATNLARELSKKRENKKEEFSCFLDQYIGEANEEIPPPVLRQLNRASMLVVVASIKAVQSKNVRKEIQGFRETRRPIHPIVFGDSPPKADLSKLLPGLSPSMESEAALDSGDIGQNVIKEIRDAATFRRQAARQRRSTFFSVSLLAILLVALVIIGWQVKEVARDLDVAGQRLSNARNVYDSQQEQEPLVKNNIFARVNPDVEPSENELQAAVDMAQARIPIQINDSREHKFLSWSGNGEDFITKTENVIYQWHWQGGELRSRRMKVGAFEAQRSASRKEPELHESYDPYRVKVLSTNDKVLAEKKFEEHVYDTRISKTSSKPKHMFRSRGLLKRPFHPGHALVAHSSSDGKSPRIWSSRYGTISLPHDEKVILVKFHPFLDIAATETERSKDDRSLHLWSFDNGKPKLESTIEMGADYSLGVPSFSPNGEILLVYGKANGIVKLSSPNKIKRLEDIPGRQQTYKFTPQGRALITIGHDHTVRVLENNSWFLKSKALHSEDVSNAFYRKNLLLTTSHDHYLRASYIKWGSDKILRKEELFEPYGFSAVVSLSGKTIFIQVSNEGFRVWRIKEKEEPGQIEFNCRNTFSGGCDFSPNGQWLASAECAKLFRIDRSNGHHRTIGGMKNIHNVRFSNDGRFLIGLPNQEKYVRIWNLESLDAWNDVPLKKQVNIAYFDTVTQKIVGIRPRQIVLISPIAPYDIKEIAIPGDFFPIPWNIESRGTSRSRLLFYITNHKKGVTKTWCVWNPSEPHIFTRRQHPEGISSVSISDDNSKVAILDYKDQVTVYGGASQKVITTFTVNTNSAPSSIRFSPSGNFLHIDSSPVAKLISLRDPKREWRSSHGSIVSYDDKWLAKFDKGIFLVRLDRGDYSVRFNDSIEVGTLKFCLKGNRLLFYNNSKALLFRYRWKDLIDVVKKREANNIRDINETGEIKVDSVNE